MRMKADRLEQWRPVAYVVVEDRTTRTAILDALHRQGWAVVEPPTGFHLVQSIAGVITGDTPWLRPGLIVIDVIARGCSGTTIAHGLRDLGLDIPIVLVAREAAPYPDDTIVVEPRFAAYAVADLARSRSPAKFLVDPKLDRRAVA